MKRVVVPIAPGFEEIETITIVDILRRAGVAVILASVEEGKRSLSGAPVALHLQGVETTSGRAGATGKEPVLAGEGRAGAHGAPPAALEGRSGIKVMADRPLSEVQVSDFDMIVLPGGLKGAQTMQNDRHVARLLRELQQGDPSRYYIAAICAAPIVLASNNMIAGRRLTSHPSVKQQLDGAIYDEGRVVIDGNLVTSRGPGTAMEFALTLVKLLEGQEKMQEIKEAVLAAV